MTILTGWREQYDRMIRSYDRLLRLAADTSRPIDEAKDSLFHFYTDAFHLADWLRGDAQVPLSRSQRKKLDKLFTAKFSMHMALCADLANGIKHFGLNNDGKTGNQDTAFTGEHEDRSLILGPFETAAEWSATSSEEPRQSPPTVLSRYRWTVGSSQQTWDAVDLAHEIVTRWQGWLKTRGLLS